MKSSGNRGVIQGSLQMLHVHVLLVAPLSTGHMAQAGADQHEGRVSVREGAHYTGPAADFSVEPFDDIVGTDAYPMFAGKITVSQSFLNTILHLFRSFPSASSPAALPRRPWLSHGLLSYSPGHGWP